MSRSSTEELAERLVMGVSEVPLVVPDLLDDLDDFSPLAAALAPSRCGGFKKKERRRRGSVKLTLTDDRAAVVLTPGAWPWKQKRGA